MRSLSIFSMILTMALSAVAQDYVDPKAKSILNKVAKRYEAYSSLKTSFSYLLEDPLLEGEVEEQKGTLYLKGDMFRVETDLLMQISDTKNTWTYVVDANEVQINNFDPEEFDILPSKLFTFYETGFLYKLDGDIKEGDVTYHQITLTPKDKEKTFHKIKVAVNITDYGLHSIKIFEKSGTRYTWKIDKEEKNPSLGDEKFRFEAGKHPGCVVVDLRE